MLYCILICTLERIRIFKNMMVQSVIMKGMRAQIVELGQVRPKGGGGLAPLYVTRSQTPFFRSLSLIPIVSPVIVGGPRGFFPLQYPAAPLFPDTTDSFYHSYFHTDLQLTRCWIRFLRRSGTGCANQCCFSGELIYCIAARYACMTGDPLKSDAKRSG